MFFQYYVVHTLNTPSMGGRVTTWAFTLNEHFYTKNIFKHQGLVSIKETSRSKNYFRNFSRSLLSMNLMPLIVIYFNLPSLIALLTPCRVMPASLANFVMHKKSSVSIIGILIVCPRFTLRQLPSCRASPKTRPLDLLPLPAIEGKDPDTLHSGERS